jgi:hypothetical protein
MATLDDALAGASKLLEQLSKQQLFGKVDASTARLPDEQRDRRIADLTTRIANLTQRKADLVASYDGAIAVEQRELDTLKAQATPVTPPPAAGNAPAPPAPSGTVAPRQPRTRARTKRNKEP